MWSKYLFKMIYKSIHKSNLHILLYLIEDTLICVMKKLEISDHHIEFIWCEPNLSTVKTRYGRPNQTVKNY